MKTPITDYPITMDVIVQGMEERKTLEKNSSVKCLRCGKKFAVNEDTAFMLKEDVPALICPREECGYKASVLYYFPKKGGHQFARYRIFAN